MAGTFAVIFLASRLLAAATVQAEQRLLSTTALGIGLLAAVLLDRSFLAATLAGVAEQTAKMRLLARRFLAAIFAMIFLARSLLAATLAGMTEQRCFLTVIFLASRLLAAALLSWLLATVATTTNTKHPVEQFETEALSAHAEAEHQRRN